MTLNIAVVWALLLVFLRGSFTKELASISYRFTPCGATGQRGPSLLQCLGWYSQESSPIFTSGALFGFQSIFQGSQGFRVPKSGVYNVTVAGAAGGRGVCNTQQGKGLLWRGTVHLLDSQDLLVSVGQKGVQPCEINKDIPVCAHTPSNETESRICFNDWEMWLYMQTLSQTAASTTSEFGGGGGGGGASMLRVRDRKTGQFNVFPIVVAGGGGGSAAVLDVSILSTLNISIPNGVPSNSSAEDLYTHFINAKMTDRDSSLADVHNFSGVRGYIAGSVDNFNHRPGAGGGYFPVVYLQQDGSPLNTSENFALGGSDCLHLSTDLSQRPLLETVHGGFGGGGGQCESGGSGGGYTGGSVFSNSYYGIPGNGGFYKYFSATPNKAVQLSVELNQALDGHGFVEIVHADCGCGYKCIVDEEHKSFTCDCPENTTLAPNEVDCYKDFIVDIGTLEQIHYTSEDLFITHIPFNESLEVFGVSSSVTLNEPSFSRSFSISNEPMCALLFIDETGSVILTTNDVRAYEGVLDKVAPVNGDFEHLLDFPYSITGAVIVSNRNCSITANILELNISETSTPVEPLGNVIPNLKNITKVTRSIHGILFEPHTTVNDDGHSKLQPTFSTVPVSRHGNILLIGSVSLMGALSVVVTATILGSLCCLYCCCKSSRTLSPKPVQSSTIHDNSMVQNLLYNHHTPSVTSLTHSNESAVKSLSRQELTASICSFTPTFDVSLPDYSFTSYNMQRDPVETNAWEYSRSGLIYMKELGEGQFGKVLLMKAHSIGGFNGMMPVAVKTLSSTDPVIVQKFGEEANLMKKFVHPNVVSLLGISFNDVDKDNAPLMILEYMPHGDLHSFLRKYRPGTTQEQEIGSCHFYCFARDVAEGLAFLSSRNHVHGDIASRNCLVGPALNIKIADFGLTKELEAGTDSYNLEGSAILPVRWLSPESIVYGTFSFATDVWSYGVLLWEIVTYGEMPLGGVSCQEILSMAESRRLGHTRPPNCPDDIGEIMTSCHQLSPENRMNIREIKQKLSQF